MRALALVALAVSAGCLAPEPVEPAALVEPEPALSASLPAMTKGSFATAPALPLPEPLAQPSVTAETIAVPPGMGWVQIAIDLFPSLRGAGGAETATAILYDPAGGIAFEMSPVSAPAKGFAWLEEPAPGDYTLEVTAKGSWEVGFVQVGLPLDFTPGIWVNVSYPEQTEIDHSFQPDTVLVKAGAKTRFTTLDYDPHAGIENLQHNLYFPDLDIKTEGQTTWGEIRTLDFVAPSQPGKYEFYCEFHERSLRGTLHVER